MKKLLFILVFIPQFLTAQTFSFTPLTGFYARPGVGNDRWNEQSGGQIVSDYTTPTVYYRRFTVPEVIDASGNPYWSRFDSKINAAIDARQRFAFRIFTMYAWPEADNFFNITPTMSGTDYRTGNAVSARAAYPLEWHTTFQGEGIKDWISESGDWVAPYNNASYISRLNGVHAHIANHLDTGSYKPTWSATAIPYKDVIQYIDVSGFGTWGEWHSYGTAPGNNTLNYPTGTFPTVATLKAIIDIHKNNYNPYQLCIIINVFDNNRLPNTNIPAEVGVYAYRTRTSKGWMGSRIDHAGEQTGYDDFYLQLNSGTFGGYRMDTASENRHRLAPFVGEPPGGPVTYNGVVQGALPLQARKWKLASIGNGNYGSTPTGQGADSVRLAFSLMGYHLQLTGGSANSTSTNLTINLNWKNFGLTPTYDHWDVEYSLRNGSGTEVWSEESSFDPYLFLPDYGNVTKTDVYTKPAIAAGMYALHVMAKDPTGYMTPLPLQITGRQSDGSYFLSNVTIPTGTANRPPVANAGPNQSITLPDDDAVLNGSTSDDPDGTISDYQWSQVSGPSTATMSAATSASNTVSDLVAGVYVFNLEVTDDEGDISDDNVTITVNTSPNIAPVAEAGNPQSVTAPADSVQVDGSGSTDDDAITAYAWSWISGPGTYTIVSPTSAVTDIEGLVPGTYVFRLTVSDGTQTDTDDVIITVAAESVPNQRNKWNRKFKAF